MDVLPHHICFKQEGWSKDTSQLPDIDVSSIKKYLINSKAQKFTVTSLGHFKLSRAYQHLDANHICNVSFNQLKHSSTFCAIKASCIPSQSGNEAKIKHVHCTCYYGQANWRTIWWILYMYSWVSNSILEEAALHRKNQI